MKEIEEIVSTAIENGINFCLRGRQSRLLPMGGRWQVSGIRCLPKFVRFAKEVWGVNGDGKTEEQIAEEGLEAMEGWMKELGVLMYLGDLDVTENIIDADGTIIMKRAVIKR